MNSTIVPEDKRFRISLLLDAYGGLLTDKQREFLKLYYENDLSFGEIAAEQGVSRQAIFDSVRHGELSLEAFETQMRLVASGWALHAQSDLTPASLADKLKNLRGKIEKAGKPEDKKAILEDLDAIMKTIAPETKE